MADVTCERHLPYAIAFGMEGSFLPGLAATQSPGWFVERAADGLTEDASLRALAEFGGQGGDLLLKGLSNVDWQQASDLAAGGLQASSDGFAALLSAAADAFSSIDLDL